MPASQRRRQRSTPFAPLTRTWRARARSWPSSPDLAGERLECRLADLVDADPSVEGLVERLLGDDLAALVVPERAHRVRRSRPTRWALRAAEGRADRSVARVRQAPSAALSDATGTVAHGPPARERRGPRAARGPSRQRPPGRRTQTLRCAHTSSDPSCTLRDRLTASAFCPTGASAWALPPRAETGALERKRQASASSTRAWPRCASAPLTPPARRCGRGRAARSPRRARTAAEREGRARAPLRRALPRPSSERGRLEAQLDERALRARPGGRSAAPRRASAPARRAGRSTVTARRRARPASARTSSPPSSRRALRRARGGHPRAGQGEPRALRRAPGARHGVRAPGQPRHARARALEARRGARRADRGDTSAALARSRWSACAWTRSMTATTPSARAPSSGRRASGTARRSPRPTPTPSSARSATPRPP